MRILLAATAVAAALVFVPIEARLEPSVPTGPDKHASSETTKTQPGAGQEFASAPGEAGSPQPTATVSASVDAICATLDRSATDNDLPLDFFTRLIWQESRFNPLSVSHAGAQGIAQFMPGTARRVGLADAFDPLQALAKSAELLRGLRAQFGNLGLAAAAYNAGPKRIDDWLANRKPLPQETESYVRIITGRSAQEWTNTQARDWGVALAVPGPCKQLARSAPRRAPPVIAIRRTDRPARAILLARKPERPAPAVAPQPAPAIVAARQPNRPASSRGALRQPEHSRAAVVAARQPERSTPVAHRVASSAKLVHVGLNVVAEKHEKTAAASKTVMTAAKSTPEHAHANGANSSAPSARGSNADASHALKRESPAAPAHKRPVPNQHAARVT
jgi:transglycosylase-like protein with SLT domain